MVCLQRVHTNWCSYQTDTMSHLENESYFGFICQTIARDLRKAEVEKGNVPKDITRLIIVM